MELITSPRVRTLRLQIYGSLAPIFAGDLEGTPQRAGEALAAFEELLHLTARNDGSGPIAVAATAVRTAGANLADSAGASDLEHLETEYVRLFLNPGPGSAGALPYGSLYLGENPRLMGPWAVEMERLLEQQGLRIPEGGVLLPDHATVACEYLSHLIGCGLASQVIEERSAAVPFPAQELSFLSGGFKAFMSALRDAIRAAGALTLFCFAGELAAAQTGLDLVLLNEAFPDETRCE